MLFAIISLFAANFKDLPSTITQPDGTVINCFVSGDEFFNYLHDAEGYTIIQSQDGWYYYAKHDQSANVVPSGLIVGSGDPADAGIPKYVKITEKAYKEKVFKYLSPLQGRNTKAPATGSFNNIVIYIRFADDAGMTNTRQTYLDMFTGTGGLTYSVQEYFQSVSYNQLTVNAVHFPDCAPTTNLSYQDTYNRNYYQPYNASTNPDGYVDDNQATIREHTLLKNAVNSLKSVIEAELTAGELDMDNNGDVDNISFIISGSNDSWSDLLWAHRWVLYSYTVTINGKQVWDYNFQPESQSNSRTTCHELFHCIGSPDLYHYSDNGVDPCWYWDLMEYGTGSMTAYMKEQICGWITIPSITTSGSYSLSPLAGATNNAYKIALPNSATEFLILEFRKKTGPVEVKLPSSADEGLLIYRINTNVSIGTGNRNGPPDMLWIYRPNGNTTTNGNPNDATFSSTQGRTSFTDVSNPACLLSDDVTWGGISITNVGAVGSTISFNVTFPSSGYDVTFNVSEGTTPLSGAEVTFNGSSQSTNTSGTTTFTGVAPASGKAYSVTKTGYHNVNGTLDVVDQNVTESVSMINSLTAINLAVQGSPATNSVTMTWDGSGATFYHLRFRKTGSSTYTYNTVTSSPFTKQLLDPNTEYECCIRTNNDGVYTAFSSPVIFTTANGASVIATNLRVAGSPATNSATLEWDGSGATWYQLRFNVSGSTAYTYNKIYSSPYTKQLLQPNTDYECSIMTCSGGVYSGYSAPIAFTTANGSSNIATNLRVEGAPLTNSVTIAWDGSGATSYQLRFNIQGNSTYSYNTISASPFTKQMLEPNTNYECCIRTNNGGVYTSFSSPVSFTTANGSSTIATNLRVMGVPGSTSVTIAWDGSGATWYQLKFNVQGTSTYTYKQILASPYVKQQLLPSTTYECRIMTCNGGVYSGYSAPILFTTAAAKSMLSEESGLQKINIYPNPVGTILNVELDVTRSGKYQIEISDIAGRIIINEEGSAESSIYTIRKDVSQWKQGIYFICVYYGEDVKTLWFIKE